MRFSCSAVGSSGLRPLIDRSSAKDQRSPLPYTPFCTPDPMVPHGYGVILFQCTSMDTVPGYQSVNTVHQCPRRDTVPEGLYGTLVIRYAVPWGPWGGGVRVPRSGSYSLLRSSSEMVRPCVSSAVSVFTARREVR